MEIVTGDRYLESLVKFVEKNAGGLIEGTLVLKLNPVGLHYVQSRVEALHELERLIAGAPVDYLRAYISDLGDHRALEQLRRILCRLMSLKVVSVLPPPARDPTPLSLLSFGRLKVLELRGCDLSSSSAKGLLELRHTLEKLICHNSTDALRHVFAGRIADIKESPHWNRLSVVSCACNGLILMDESLQLLPAVETLDLSRNKFAKVDNLRKCTRLKHLDLGFNQLRSVASLSEVTCHISKLVLRSNALTTLRGIETLKQLEGLDISYNIISNFLELEVLLSLPSLKNLWLEGNPLCCARWYRAQVFSFFARPEQVKLDDREMSTREFWKRQIIVTRRQRRPASYGYYYPARENNEGEGFAYGKRKKLSRLVCIESEEHGMNMFFEQDSSSYDIDIQNGDENIVSDNEGEITSLINRIEFMKKERSGLWLEDFKYWMDEGSENLVDEDNNGQAMLGFGKGKLADKTSWGHIRQTLRYTSDSIITSGDDRSTNVFEPISSFACSSGGNHGHQWIDSATENGDVKPATINKALEEDHLKFHLHKGDNYLKMTGYSSMPANISIQGVDKMNAAVTVMPLTAINNIMESRTSSMHPGSPPHYQEDILHRRHCLEEEFLQLSAESISIASSDSDTSYDEDDGHELSPPYPKFEQFAHKELMGSKISSLCSPLSVGKDDNGLYSPDAGDGGSSVCAQQTSGELNELEHYLEFSCDVPPGGNNDDVTTSNKQDADCYQKKSSKRKPRKRVVLLSEDDMFSCGEDVKDELRKYYVDDIDCIGRSCTLNAHPPHDEAGGVLSHVKHSAPKADEYIENYFSSCCAVSTIHET